ncbi:MAG: DUF4249 family protein, partial [Bacteroidota bacterium]|nr:DUF4249 family protein [Bacteroidota bacterium]
KIIVKAIEQEVSAEFSFPNKNYDVEFSKSDFVCDTFQIENSFYDYMAEGNAIIKINTNEQKYFMISFLSNTWNVDYEKIEYYESVFPDSVYYHSNSYFNLSSNRPYQEENNQYVYAPFPYMKFESYSDGSNIFTNNLGNDELSISGNLAFGGTKQDSEEIYLKYRVFEISEEMYDYYLSREKYMDSDDNPFVEPVNIYSNVANGFGVVATYNVYEDSLKIDITEVK